MERGNQSLGSRKEVSVHAAQGAGDRTILGAMDNGGKCATVSSIDIELIREIQNLPEIDT